MAGGIGKAAGITIVKAAAQSRVTTGFAPLIGRVGVSATIVIRCITTAKRSFIGAGAFVGIGQPGLAGAAYGCWVAVGVGAAAGWVAVDIGFLQTTARGVGLSGNVSVGAGSIGVATFAGIIVEISTSTLLIGKINFIFIRLRIGQSAIGQDGRAGDKPADDRQRLAPSDPGRSFDIRGFQRPGALNALLFYLAHYRPTLFGELAPVSVVLPCGLLPI